MSRTPLARMLEHAAADAAIEARGGTTRRELLRRGAAAGLGLSALGRFASAAGAATAPRIVIVGAGLAGLSCAYRLRQAGHVAQVYEASDRVGGRCWTGRGTFADGQLYEHGGELIDQGHNQIRNLAQELGLKLGQPAARRGERDGVARLLRRRAVPVAEITDDLKPVWQKIHADVTAASYPTLFDSSTERGRVLDRMSIVN
jgi:monoamine oxidase